MNTKDNVIEIVDKLYKQNHVHPIKKTMQKIVYLIQNKGCDLGYDYDIHFYGPYSSDLDYDLQTLNRDDQLLIEYTSMGHKISVQDKAVYDLSNNNIIDEVIVKYGGKTPFDLELIATTLFVQRNLETGDESQIIQGVKKLKGEKYAEKQIKEAFENLEENAFLNCI